MSSALPRRLALTLTELLVVIALLGVLAGMLTTAFSLVRNTAQQANCLSNLRQYGVAILAYSAENRGYAPQTAPYTPVETNLYVHAFGTYVWTTCFSYGLERADQASCPTVRRLQGIAPSAGISSYNYNQVVGGVTDLVLLPGGTTYWLRSRRLTGIVDLSSLMLFSETAQIFGTQQNYNWYVHAHLRDLDPNGPGNYDHAAIIHQTGNPNTVGMTGLANYVAGDGHAQGVVFTQAAINRRWPGTRIQP